MKNICFFIYNITRTGGTERVCTVIANRLIELNFNVQILSLTCEGPAAFKLNENIKSFSLFKTKYSNISKYTLTSLKLRRFVKNNNIDIFIDVESMLSIYSIPALMNLNINHVCWEHFNYTINLNKKLRNFSRILAARFCDSIITLTNQDKELWLSNLKCNAKIISIPNPITASMEHNREKVEKKKLFLAVGRLTHQKGFDLLLKAWKSVSIHHPEWKLRIIGDGKEKKSLDDLCLELDLNDNVDIIPSTKNISSHYLESAFFVMSSRFEGLPLVLIEAQAHYVPSISFDCLTGPRDIIIQNETGWLCPPECIDDLRDAMNNAIFLFENKNDVYIEMSHQASLNTRKFSMENVIPLWLNILNIQKS